MQLCAPCQAAVRSGHIAQITGPHTRQEGKALTYQWSCALCTIISTARDPEVKREKKRLLWPWNRVKTIPFRADALYPTKGLLKDSSNAPIQPIGDMTDVLIFSSKVHRSDCQFQLEDAILSSHPAPTHPIVRVVPQSTIDETVVKRWLSYCAENHRMCIPEPPKSKLRLLLIDVRRKCLISTAAAPYFALSYVWGNVDQFLLKEADLPGLKKENALLDHWDRMAPVLKDAIAFVDSLSEQYLWADTICIIQDSDKRHSYISRMNEVYRGAVCTLIAIDSIDAMSRLPGVSPKTRNVCSLGKNAHLEMVRRRLDLASICMSSTYERRAWTFQERTLSRKCLYFTREQLYFHCQQATWSEDRYEHYEEGFGAYPSLNLTLHGSVLQWEAKFDLYGQLVQLYSKRELSYASDRLNAFSGIASDLREKWGWGFAAGLPTLFLDIALMWVSTTQTLRRIETDDVQQYLPTWSWAGWKDGVHYRMALGSHLSALRLHREILIHRFAITMARDVNIFDISSDGATSTAAEVPKRPYCDSGTQKDEEGVLDLIHPDLIKMSNLLIFWTETIPKHKLQVLATAQASPCKIYGEEAENHEVCRLVRTKRSAGLLMHSGKLHNELQDSYTYEYILISRSEKKPFISSVVDRVYDPDSTDPLPLNNYVYSTYYWKAPGRTLCIMLIRYMDKGYAERVAVGQIHEAAWNDAQPTRKKIYLG